MNSVAKRIELLKKDEQVFRKAGWNEEQVKASMKKAIVVMIKELPITAEDFKQNKEFFEKYGSVDISARKFTEEPAFEDLEYQTIKRTIEQLKLSGIKFEINFLNKVIWKEPKDI